MSVPMRTAERDDASASVEPRRPASAKSSLVTALSGTQVLVGSTQHKTLRARAEVGEGAERRRSRASGARAPRLIP